MYLDKNYIDLHLNKYRFDLLEIDNISSLSYKRKLRHKYFLYDDFDDPFYIAEWAYLRMMSSTCRLLTVWMGTQKRLVFFNLKVLAAVEWLMCFTQ